MVAVTWRMTKSHTNFSLFVVCTRKIRAYCKSSHAFPSKSSTPNLKHHAVLECDIDHVAIVGHRRWQKVGHSNPISVGFRSAHTVSVFSS